MGKRCFGKTTFSKAIREGELVSMFANYAFTLLAAVAAKKGQKETRDKNTKAICGFVVNVLKKKLLVMQSGPIAAAAEKNVPRTSNGVTTNIDPGSAPSAGDFRDSMQPFDLEVLRSCGNSHSMF